MCPEGNLWAHRLPDLILVTTLGRRNHYVHFTEETTEAQAG